MSGTSLKARIVKMSVPELEAIIELASRIHATKKLQHLEDEAAKLGYTLRPQEKSQVAALSIKDQATLIEDTIVDILRDKGVTYSRAIAFELVNRLGEVPVYKIRDARKRLVERGTIVRLRDDSKHSEYALPGDEDIKRTA